MPSALADAKRSLNAQRELDATLVHTAIASIEAAKQVDPLEIHRIFSIPQLEKASVKAFDALASFASASRSDLPEFDRLVRRPEVAEARAEVKRHAVYARDGVVDGSKALGQAVSQGAKQVSESVREKVRRKSD